MPVWGVTVKNQSGRNAASLRIRFKQNVDVNPDANKLPPGVRAILDQDSGDLILTHNGGSVANNEKMSFSIFCSAESLDFLNGNWGLTADASSWFQGGKVLSEDVRISRNDSGESRPSGDKLPLTVPPPDPAWQVPSPPLPNTMHPIVPSLPRKAKASLKFEHPHSSLRRQIRRHFLGAYMGVAALASLIFGVWSLNGDNVPKTAKGTVPLATIDIEKRLGRAIAENSAPENPNGRPPFQNRNTALARAIASKMKTYSAEYNRPVPLLLGKSSPVQLVIKTNETQQFPPFKDFQGDITPATILAASDVSAHFSGQPDRLQITLRDKDEMRTILSPDPLSWIWDVRPLKPGDAQVTLTVTSYIKIGKNTEPMPYRVLQDTWTVEAHGMEWAKYEIQEIQPVQAFIFALVGAAVASLGWFGIKGLARGGGDFS